MFGWSYLFKVRQQVKLLDKRDRFYGIEEIEAKVTFWSVGG